MQGERKFNSGIQNKHTFGGGGFSHFDARMTDSSKINGRLWNENRKSNIMDINWVR